MSENLIDAADTDALAAEYVLGTLDPDERTAAKRLLAADTAFAAKVKVWERRLGELHLMVEPVEPDPGIWQRIKSKLPELPPEPVIALPEVAPEPEPAPRPEPSPEPDGEPAPRPEPQAAQEAEPGSQQPGAEPKPESGPQPAFWPELERALLEAQSALTADQSPPKETEHTAYPPIEPAAGDAKVAETASEAMEGRSEPLAAPDRPTESAAPRSSADTTAPSAAPSEQAAPRSGQPAAEREQKILRVLKRRLARWRAFAFLIMLAVLAVAAIPALWKFAPDRVPAGLEPDELLRRIGIRMETPPGSRPSGLAEPQFEE